MMARKALVLAVGLLLSGMGVGQADTPSAESVPPTEAWMQGYLRADVLPGDAQVRTARASLLARPDVQDAVAKVGRIDRYAFYQVDGTD